MAVAYSILGKRGTILKFMEIGPYTQPVVADPTETINLCGINHTSEVLSSQGTMHGFFNRKSPGYIRDTMIIVGRYSDKFLL